MSKAAHNSCQAGADIPTGLGMRQKSTFAMSRLRHKRAVGKILPQKLWHLFGGEDFLTGRRALDSPANVAASTRASWLVDYGTIYGLIQAGNIKWNEKCNVV